MLYIHSDKRGIKQTPPQYLLTPATVAFNSAIVLFHYFFLHERNAVLCPAEGGVTHCGRYPT